MKLANLHIDRFGARWNLHLGELSEGLNVVYGPNGSGKTTTIAFLRWMLFGRSQTSQSYLNSAARPARGSLTIVSETGGVATLHREDGDDRPDHLQWEPSNMAPGADWAPMSVRDFDLLFSPSWDRPDGLEELLECASTHQLELAFDTSLSQQIRRLEAQCQELDRQLNRLDCRDNPGTLRQQIDELTRHMDQLQAESHFRRYQLQDELDRLERQIAHTVARQHEVHGRLEQVDSEVRGRLDDARREVEAARQLRDETRREAQRLAGQLDEQIGKWSATLADVRQRLAQLPASDPGEPPAWDGKDQAHLELLAEMLSCSRIDLSLYLDADQDPVAVDAQVAQWNDRLASAMDVLRKDASRIAHYLRYLRQRERAQQEAAERQQLGRIERELGELVDRLSARRAAVTAMHPVAEPWSNGQRLSDPLAGHHRWLQWRVGPLRQERDDLQSRLQGIECQLAEHYQMRDRLRQQMAEMPDWRRLEDARRQRDELQRQLEDWHRLATLREERDGLLAQVHHLRQQAERSTLLDDASRHLRELSDGELRELRLHASGHLQIVDHRQSVLDWRQLGRGARDQVFLSLCVAAVSALRAQRVIFPLVLSDPFAHCDASRLAVAARWLESLARQGLQIVLFTRHEHILDRFRSLDARIFSLRPRSADSAASAPERTGDIQRHDRPAPAAVAAESSDQSTAETPASTPLPRFQWVTRWEEGRPQRRGSVAANDWPIRAGVAQLSRPEAQLLIECGIDDVSMLAGLEAEAVARRIEAFLVRPELESRYGTARDYPKERIRGWIQAARESVARSGETVPRSPRLYREELPAAGSPPVRTPAADLAEPLRFFLEPGDAIVDAPAIGPRTAERLQQQGIQSVADLLAADPQQLAKQLGHRRIGPETIQRWQTQARLVCRVPNLRGYDAQILVACHITQPETLAQQSTEGLWSTVERYCTSSEGRRVLHGGRTPTPAQVGDWIRWARSARPLRAA